MYIVIDDPSGLVSGARSLRETLSKANGSELDGSEIIEDSRAE